MTRSRYIGLIVLMLTNCNFLFAQREIPGDQSLVCVYPGVSYRVPDQFLFAGEICYENYVHNCNGSRFIGLGFRYDTYGSKGYSISPKLYTKIFPLRSRSWLVYTGISSVFFKTGVSNGMNLKPEIGFRYSPFLSTQLGMIFNISYGYEIPVYSKIDFPVGRNDVFARVGFFVNMVQSSQWRMRKIERQSRGLIPTPVIPGGKKRK